jgi:hypothetical protein
MWMMVLFAILSYMKKHCWELIERSQAEAEAEQPAPAPSSGNVPLPEEKAHAI